MGSFLRATINDDNFIRGAARLLVAAEAQGHPADLDDIIQLTTTGTNEVQTLTITGIPTGGTFRLGFRGAVTAPIAYNATAAAVAAAVAALTTVGTGNVTGGGGPLPGTAVTLTFVGGLAAQNVDLLVVQDVVLTGGTTPTAAIALTTQGAGQYDPQTGWSDLGATKTGVQIVRNNAEETFDVDQIMGDIASEPTNWEMNVGTQLAEMNLESLDLAWEAGAITTSFVPTVAERHLPVGLPTAYVRRRLAVLHQRSNGKIRAYVFRKVQRMPQESTITHAKTGEQISIPVRFRCLADATVTDVDARFGEIIDQL